MLYQTMYKTPDQLHFDYCINNLSYILFEFWDELFNGQEEISAVQFSELCFGKVFGWNEQKEYEVLEHLADKGIIRLNKQLVPYTILRLTDKNAVMARLYSELC